MSHGWVSLDIGRIVGRFLQLIACLSLVEIVIAAVYYDEGQFDISFIFVFWAGAALVRHSPTARKWVIGVTGFVVLSCAAMATIAVVCGTEGWYLVRWRTIDDPSLGQVLSNLALVAVVAGAPLVLLLTPRARREFHDNTCGVTSG